jgi:hypothetical protein
MDILSGIKRYICKKPKDWYYNMKWLFKNLWNFRKELWNFRSWDFGYCIEMFARSLELLSEQIKNGHEEERSSIKKTIAINELVMQLRKLSDDNDFGCLDEFFDEDGVTIPIDEYDRMHIKRRNKTLNRIYRLLKGQDVKEFEGTTMFGGGDEYDKWVEKFDGTGYEGWWD